MKSILAILMIACQLSLPLSANAWLPDGPGINIQSRSTVFEGRAGSRTGLAEEIKALGFTHVRLNIYTKDAINQQKTALRAEWINLINRIIKDAHASGLGVILDAHDFIYCRSNWSRCQKSLALFWSLMADEFSNSCNRVAFSILNEPSGEISPSAWNEFLANLLPEIRSRNPCIGIIISAPTSGNGRAIKLLKIPEIEGDIAVEFHYYAPLEFTHQGAPWISGSQRWLGRMWGSYADIARLQIDLEEIFNIAKNRNIRLYAGEIGVYEAADEKSKICYLQTLTRKLEKNGVPWAIWQLEGDFSLYNRSNGDWNQANIGSLFSKNKDLCM